VVNGQRAPDGFSGRALPHFPRGTRTPEGKGFVAASFYRCAQVGGRSISLEQPIAAAQLLPLLLLL
jgi:RNA polymerase Rpb1, domain 4